MAEPSVSDLPRILEELKLKAESDRYLAAHISKLLREEYGGRWVALYKGRVVAAADTFNDLKRLMLEKRGDTFGVVMEYVAREGPNLLL